MFKRSLFVEMLAPAEGGGFYRIDVPDAMITGSTLRVGPWPGPVLIFQYSLRKDNKDILLELGSESNNLRLVFLKTSDDPRNPKLPRPYRSGYY